MAFQQVSRLVVSSDASAECDFGETGLEGPNAPPILLDLAVMTGPVRDGGSDDAPVVLPPRAQRLRVGVGNPFRAPGRTLVEVDPSGVVSLATARRDKVVRDRGRIDRGRAAIIIEAADGALSSLDSSRPVRPLADEAIYLFELREGDRRVAGAHLPERSVEADGNFLCVLRALCEIVAELAPGRHQMVGAGID